MFIEVHILQSFAPSDLNRDDTNTPKDCEFGGVRRARISSQCIKRAIRNAPVFNQKTAVEPGTRTRWMNRLLAEALTKVGKDEPQAKAVSNAISSYYCKMDKDNKHTSVLVYLSQTEIKTLTNQLLAKWDEITANPIDEKNPMIFEITKDLFKTLKNRTSAPDIALFGRMLAENPKLNIDAACQVAHAISTHRVTMEMDFYTAVDDLARDEEPGAGMMGVTGFNSACFYRYARIDWKQLLENLAGERELALRTVEGFLLAANTAVPTGKQKSFAAENPPSLILVVIRHNDQGWSLANAFEKPVTAPHDGGLIAPSVQELDKYWGKIARVYGSQGLTAHLLLAGTDLELNALKEYTVNSLEELVTRTLQALQA